MKNLHCLVIALVVGITLLPPRSLCQGTLNTSPAEPTAEHAVAPGVAGLDKTFGGGSFGYSGKGPVGAKGVLLGKHVYITTEQNSEILKDIPEHAQTSVSGNTITESQPKNSPWHEWYRDLLISIASSWKADLPGQMQVLVRAKPDATLQVVEQQAFVSAFDEGDRLITAENTPGLVERFRKGIDEALEQCSKGGKAAFPSVFHAKSVLLMANFSADHDLIVSIMDLRQFDQLPPESHSARIVKICSVLDAGGVFDLSDRLRSHLPVSFRHRFIPDGQMHSLDSEVSGANLSANFGPRPPCVALGSALSMAEVAILTHMKLGDFQAAKRLAVRLTGPPGLAVMPPDSKPEQQSNHRGDQQERDAREKMIKMLIKNIVPAF